MNNCIFITFDDGHFIYAQACLNSFVANYPDHPPIKVLYKGNDPRVFDFLSKLPNVFVFEHHVDFTQFETLNLGSIGSPMIYVRFILWTDLFDEYDNVVYLDCDTIILKPFPEIFESKDFFSILDNSADPRQGIFEVDVTNDVDFLTLLEQDNMEYPAINRLMINSGFFVLPKKYRTKEHLDQIWQISKKYNKYIMHSDQSVISIWCYLNKIKISEDYKYNFQILFLFGELIKTIDFDSIKVLHFSYLKPYKNYEDSLLPAKFVIKAYEIFCSYSHIDSK